MPEGMKLIVTSDVTQAEQGLKKFVATAGKEGERAATSINAGLSKINPAATKTFSNISSQAKIAIKPISALGDSIETLRAKLLARKEFLITEKDITKVAALNVEIKQLEAEIIKIQNIGTGGIAQQLGGVGTAVKGGFGFLRQAANILPGIGIAGLVGGLADLVTGLFKTDEAFSKTELSAEKFSVQIKNASEEIARLVDRLDFGAEIDKLRAKLSLGEGFKFDIASIGIDKAANDKIIQSTNGIIAELDKQASRLRSNLFAFGSKAGKELADQFAAIDIPDNLLKNLSQFDRETLQQLKANAELVDQAEKKREKAIDENEKLGLQHQIRNAEEQKDINKKKKEDFEKFVNDTISHAERLSSFLDKRGILNIGAGFKLDPTKSKIENFDDAEKFISKALRAQFPFMEIILPPIKFVDPNNAAFESDIKDAESEILKHLKKAVSSTPAIVPIPIDPQVVLNADLLQKQMESINKILKSGFADLFAGIGEGIANGKLGENVTNVLGGVIQQIGKALIEYGIVKTGLDKILQGGIKIPGAVAVGLGIAAVAIGQLIKNAKPEGFAQGGLVFGPTLGLVGEGSGTRRSNPEVIAPLDKLKGMIGGQTQLVVLKTIISGNNLALVDARTSRSQKRLAV